MRIGLYRILGNTIPFRHSPSQTLDNLNFILEYEREFDNCTKIWILNRIIDKNLNQKIKELITKKSHLYIEIPFSQEKLDSIPLLNEKIKYITNNNGARNYCLENGVKKFDWTLPFDGNCYFDLNGWHSLVSVLNQKKEIKYLIVQLDRLNKLPKPNQKTRILSTDEPQIAFHKNAIEKFRPDLVYGQYPKAELLVRLNIHGPWHSWVEEKISISAESHLVLSGGYVSRLPSGNKLAERNIYWRSIVRDHGKQLLAQITGKKSKIIISILRLKTFCLILSTYLLKFTQRTLSYFTHH